MSKMSIVELFYKLMHNTISEFAITMALEQKKTLFKRHIGIKKQLNKEMLTRKMLFVIFSNKNT